MTLLRTPSDSRLALRIVSALRGVAMSRVQVKVKLGIPARARRVNDLLRLLRDAGILVYVTGTAGYTLARDPRPGELDPPRPRAFAFLAKTALSDGLEVERIRFLDTGEERVVVRRVVRGGTWARVLVGLRPETATELADALTEMADRRNVVPFPSRPAPVGGGAA